MLLSNTMMLTFVEAPYHYIDYYFMFHILFIHCVHAWTLNGIYFNWIKKTFELYFYLVFGQNNVHIIPILLFC